jgi:hypothetical protein
MTDAFVAVRTATDLRAHAFALRRQWDATFNGQAPSGVRSVIADSWRRMLGNGVAPDRLRPSSALDVDGLAVAREASPLLHAMPTLRGCLETFADDAEHIMVVADAGGKLLWIEGHDAVLEQAMGIDFTPGMRWSEDSAGTNAIGTALAIDHAVQIFSAEHFLPEQHPWWCSAAPIHDPRTGSLLGIVNLSGPQRTAHPHSLGLVMAAAAMAEDSLRHRVARAPQPVPPGRPVPGWRGDRPPADAPTAPTAPTATLRLLCPHRPTLTLPGQPPIELGLRQAEVLALLALRPDGMTGEQLTLALYGDEGNPVSTRALVSKLRDVVGAVLATRPYRLAGDVHVDLLVIRELLAAGRGHEALAGYPGPLLQGSEVETLVAVRDEVDAAVRRVALQADAEALWHWLQTPTGRVDLAAAERFLAVANPDDPRTSLVDSRRRVLLESWD